MNLATPGERSPNLWAERISFGSGWEYSRGASEKLTSRHPVDVPVELSSPNTAGICSVA
jgi:hypothetical protein